MRISDWSSDVCSSDLWSEFSPWLSKNPPAITIDLPVVLIALRLHAIGYPLIDGRKTIAYLHFLQRIEIDHHDTARARRGRGRFDKGGYAPRGPSRCRGRGVGRLPAYR